MAEFKEGDIVYHKATGQQGVVVGPPTQAWMVAWKENTRTLHTELELLTEKEHKQKYPGAVVSSFET